MSTDLQVFDGGKFGEVRVINEDGETWVVAEDVLRALGYSEKSRPARVCAAVPDDWRGVKVCHTPGGDQKLLCLKEFGLYFFLGRVNKDRALPFQRWVSGEVIPSIRRTGAYIAPIAKPDVSNVLDMADDLAGSSGPSASMVTELMGVIGKQNQALEDLTYRLDKLGVAVAELAVRTNFDQEVAAVILNKQPTPDRKSIAALPEPAPVARMNPESIRDAYFTVNGYARLHGVTTPSETASQQLGKFASAECRKRGLEIRLEPHPRLGKINSYPASVLDSVMGGFIAASVRELGL